MTTLRTISNLIRICIIGSIILSTCGQALGSKTTWIAAAGASNDWHLATNWDNGVPTMMDSAIITGGTANLNVNILIISPAEALHVTIEQHCILSLLSTGILLIIDSPGHAITIEENGSLVNFGIVNTAFTGNGIFVLGQLENHNKIIANNTGNGIVFRNNAIGINKGGGINPGLIEISDCINGISCDGLVTNEMGGTINIIDCRRGIINDQSAIITNNGDLNLTQIREVGLFNSAVFVNNSKLKFKDIGPALNSYAILNDIGTSNSAYFENNMQILMFDITSTAIQLNHSTSFYHNGLAIVFDINGVTANGLIVKPQANFTITENGSLYLPLTNDIPLDVHLGGVFNVDEGGILDIKN